MSLKYGVIAFWSMISIIGRILLSFIGGTKMKGLSHLFTCQCGISLPLLYKRYPLKPTKNKDNCGTNVRMSNVINIAKKKGITARDNVSIDKPDMPEATNKFTPRGGVIKPIAKLTTMTIPKCIGSKPMLTAIGSKIGVKIMIAANVS